MNDFDVVHRNWMGQVQQRVVPRTPYYPVNNNPVGARGGGIVGSSRLPSLPVPRPGAEVTNDVKKAWLDILNFDEAKVGVQLKSIFDCLQEVEGHNARRLIVDSVQEALAQGKLSKEQVLIILSTLSEGLPDNAKALYPVIFDYWFSLSEDKQLGLKDYFLNFCGGICRSPFVSRVVKRQFIISVIQLCEQSQFDRLLCTALWACCSCVDYGIGAQQFVDVMKAAIRAAEEDWFQIRGELMCILLSFAEASTEKFLPTQVVLGILDLACHVEESLSAFSNYRVAGDSAQINAVHARIYVAMALVLYSRPEVFRTEFAPAEYPNFFEKTSAALTSAITCRMTPQDLARVRKDALGYSRCPSAVVEHSKYKGKKKPDHPVTLLPDKRIDDSVVGALQKKSRLFDGASEEYEDARRSISSSFSRFFSLPDDLVTHIISFVSNPKDVLSCSMVCKDWRRLAVSGQIWMKLFINRKFYSKRPFHDRATFYHGHRWLEFFKRKVSSTKRTYMYSRIPQIRAPMYVCDYPECNKAYGNLNTLHTHLRKHARHPYFCRVPHCRQRMYDNEIDMMKHVAKHLEEFLKKNKVPQGGYVPIERKKIQSSYAKKGETPPHGAMLCQTGDCTFWTLGGEEALKKHQRRIHSERKLQCEECKKVNLEKFFLHQSDLKHHIQRVHSEKTQVCDHCGKAFAVSLDLLRHQQCHAKTRKEKAGKKEKKPAAVAATAAVLAAAVTPGSGMLTIPGNKRPHSPDVPAIAKKAKNNQ